MLPTLPLSIFGTCLPTVVPFYILTVVLHSFDWKPAALVYPTDSAGVAAAVKCGASDGVKVNARSGGHSCQWSL